MKNLFKSLLSVLRLLLDNKLQIRYRRIDKINYRKELTLLENNGITVDSILEVTLPNIQLVVNKEFIVDNYKLSITNSSNIPALLKLRKEELKDNKIREQHTTCNKTIISVN